MTDFYDIPENAIEWLKGQRTATVTLARGSLNTRVRKLSKSHPQKCQIRDENEDGTIVAHIPVSWIRINPEKEYSEEVLEKYRVNAKKNLLRNERTRSEKEGKTPSKRKK